jgi:AraC-like DNA-binding protein
MTELFHNIRSLYQFKAPHEELKNYIEFFSESCFESTRQIVDGHSFSIKMFSSWTPTFWINLGPSYDLILNGTRRRITANSAVAVTRSATTERVNQPSDHLFTVKFYPGALNHLLQVEQTKLHSAVVQVNELLPPYLVEKVKAAASFEKRVSLMEEFFLVNIPKKNTKDHYADLVNQTISSYDISGMKYNVSELAGKNFTSSKTLRRYFERVIGTTPKLYFESVRLRTALPSFLSDRKGFDPSLHGYYDKSHFYRSVIRFTGERIDKQMK